MCVRLEKPELVTGIDVRMTVSLPNILKRETE